MEVEEESWLWCGCSVCERKIEPVIRSADFMVNVRATPYGLADDGVTIDMRVSGVCADCGDSLTEWQKGGIQEVDLSNPHLVYNPPKTQ